MAYSTSNLSNDLSSGSRFVFLLLYNNLIPISLYVTIELVNIGQSLLVSSDLNIYEESLDLPCSVRSSNLCQELGLVSNIFSDKTGTLTRNEMKLVKFIVDGQIYDIGTEIVSHGQTVKSPVVTMLADKKGKGAKIYDFMQCLTVCHTVVRQKDGTYRAESPDELALVEGVACYDCGLKERGTASMIVNLVGVETTFDILAVNAFNADRKRMSILVRNQTNNEYLVLCKGADNIMLPLCEIDTHTRKSIEKSLLDLANFGLRTLCIAQKKLTAQAANEWLETFKAAASSLQDRAEKLATAAADLEMHMELVGITAIEDRLQDEVPEVIADLAKAKIVLWMLTGDKEETAVNIGRSCNLVLNNTKLFFVTRIDNNEAYKTRLEEVFKEITAGYTLETGFVEDGVQKEIALVMDGPSFRYFDENDATQRMWLLRIGKHCRSVIACRLTPIQKQQLVALVKKDTVPRAITLAIGDGANDVPMIREGDVGVGIFGKEGRQAANNADFAIGQFKFLRRLLLVHGRWNYSRQSRVFLYSMHKNMVITLTLYWFSYYAAVSGTSIYESWVYTSFNFVLGLPIIFYGIQDRDISDAFAMKNPQVYSTGTENVYLTPWVIGSWILNAILYATMICLLYYYATRDSFQYQGLYNMGTTVFVGMCNALQLKVAFMMHQCTWPQAFMFFISIWGMILYIYLAGQLTDDFYYIPDVLYRTGLFWFFGFFSVPLFTVMVDIVSYYLFFFFQPSREMKFRETEHLVC
jgi:phospholipid-transporting ATPase